MRINVQTLPSEATASISFVLIILLIGGLIKSLNPQFLLPISGAKSEIKSNFQPSNSQYEPPNRGSPKATQATGSRG